MMGIALFLYPDDALILIESCVQARINVQRVASLLQRLGFILIHDKCQFESTKLFTHLGLSFDTREMTMSYPETRYMP